MVSACYGPTGDELLRFNGQSRSDALHD